jgi:hypothetical protein
VDMNLVSAKMVKLGVSSIDSRSCSNHASLRLTPESNRARIQCIKPSILRMKITLFALRLNELLGYAARVKHHHET